VSQPGTQGALHAARAFYWFAAALLAAAAAILVLYPIMLAYAVSPLIILHPGLLIGVIAWRTGLLAAASYQRARVAGRRLTSSGAGIAEQSVVWISRRNSSRLFRIGDVLIALSFGLTALVIVLLKPAYFSGIPSGIGVFLGFMFYLIALIYRLRGK
jgi:hypothetical protein